MKVLIGAPCRQSPEIFTEYLENLDNLEIPEGVEVTRFFILHNSPELLPLLINKPNTIVAEYQSDDTYIKDEETHKWDWGNLASVARMKNAIIDFARENDFDYVFFVDTDVILHPKTLVTLIEAQKDIVAEVFWSKWTPEDIYAPNAWDYNAYELKSADRLAEWRVPGLYQIGMTGACILLSKPVIQNPTVHYGNIPNLLIWGEDRHFCIRAAVNGYEIWLDTHYPCIHLYRDSEYEKFKKGELKHESPPNE